MKSLNHVRCCCWLNARLLAVAAATAAVLQALAATVHAVNLVSSPANAAASCHHAFSSAWLRTGAATLEGLRLAQLALHGRSVPSLLPAGPTTIPCLRRRHLHQCRWLPDPNIIVSLAGFHCDRLTLVSAGQTCWLPLPAFSTSCWR